MNFNITIIGGGMVGAALACALRDTPLQIALIDAAPLDSTEDARLIALNASSVCLFKNLGIWEKLAAHASAIKQIHVSQRRHFGVTRINAKDAKLDALGYVVPAQYINSALYDELSQLKNIHLFRPAQLKTLQQNNEKITLTINNAAKEQSLTTKIVLAADGTHSTIRELLGINAQTIDYQQSALVTITELQRDHHHIAYERFQAQGAIAMLPLTEQRAATIWTSSHDEITHLLQLDDAEFLAQLQKNFGYRLGRLKKIGKRASYPLKMVQAAQQRKDNVLLLGNAAHTLHPIAAQGLNLALYEVACLAEYLAEQNPETLSLQHLPAFSQQQNFSSQLSHRLTWLFANDFFIVNIARQAGMIGLDLCTAAKQRFALQSIGRVGHIPRLFFCQSRSIS
jgi:2-octaprenyl-6-methoxyphenol hydroxylase